MKNKRAYWQKALSILVTMSILQMTWFAPIASALPANTGAKVPPPPRQRVEVKVAHTANTSVQPRLSLSQNPTDQQITNARIFSEPLIPMQAKKVDGENAALSAALMRFQQRLLAVDTAGKQATDARDDISDFKVFLQQYPNSRWRPSLESNLAAFRLDAGYFSEALAFWSDAWRLAKSQTGPQPKQVADGAAAHMLMLLSRLGREQELSALLAELKARPLYGSVHTEYDQAQDSLVAMRSMPDRAFRCGPSALEVIANKRGLGRKVALMLVNCKSTKRGTNLAQLVTWSKQAGLHLQAARRSPGAQIIVPSVVHWKLGHFGALVSKDNRGYHLEDKTFDRLNGLRVSENALDQESDGYFLIPEGRLPSGWRTVGETEAASIYGKGVGDQTDPDDKKKDDCKSAAPPGTCPNCGMPQPAIFTEQATHNISDIPLRYQPPIGQALDFAANYNYDEANQPGTFYFSNLGPNWSLNWVSWVKGDQPRYQDTATVQVRGGGAEQYQWHQFAPRYWHDETSGAVLSGHYTSSAEYYQRDLPDGTREIFDKWDGVVNNGRWFLTSVIDPQGNRTTIDYDSDLRVTTVTDAFGQVSTVTYGSNTSGNPGFYVITQITDPFGRSATFKYDSSYTQLISITDQMGMTSSFAYGTSNPSFIEAMTTPYGTTTFSTYTPAGAVTSDHAIGLEIDLPDGSSQKLERWIGFTARSFYWDREALAMYPNDPANADHSHCKITKWLYENSSSTISALPLYVRPPLDDITWYVYYGQEAWDSGHTDNIRVGPYGTIRQPVATLRYAALSPDSRYSAYPNPAPSSPVQASYATYAIANVDTSGDLSPAAVSFGYPLQTRDSLSSSPRTVNYSYAANNIDMISAQNASGQMLSQAVFNLQHEPVLVTNASAQPWQFSYNDQGQRLSQIDPLGNTVTNTYSAQPVVLGGTVSLSDTKVLSLSVHNSGLPGGVQTVSHTYTSGDTLATITADLASQINANSNLQSQNITASWVRFEPIAQTPALYVNSFSSNSTTYSVSATGTGNETITLANTLCGYLKQVQGPLGSTNVNTFSYDGYGRLYSTVDPEGYTRTFGYDSGDRLTQVSYPDGTAEKFMYDRLDRVVSTDRLGRSTQRVYDSVDQLVSETDALGRQTKYCWCFCGSLRSLTDAKGNVTEWDHDLQGRVVAKKYADSTLEQRSYDALGRLATKTDALGQVATFSYNSDNTLASTDYSASNTPDVSYQYDSNFPRLTEVQNSNATTDFKYSPGAVASFGSLNIGGSPAQSNTITVTVSNCRLPGGSLTLPAFTLGAADTTTSQTAIDLATSINSNQTINGAGIVAFASGSSVMLPADKPTTASASVTGGVTASAGTSRTGTAGGAAMITIGGSPASGDVITAIFVNDALSNANYSMSYTLTSSDTGNAVQTATDLADAINQNSTLSSAGIIAYHIGANVYCTATCPIALKPTSTGTTTATNPSIGSEAMLAISNPATSDTVSPKFFCADLGVNNPYTMSAITIPSQDNANPTGAATDIAASINSNSTLSNAGIHAYPQGKTVVVTAASSITVSASATGSIKAANPGGGSGNRANFASFWVAGSPQSSDTITATFTSPALPSSHVYTMPAYTVPGGDVGNPAALAADFATAITANSTLSTAGISAANVSGANLVTVSASSPVTVSFSTTGTTAAVAGGGTRLFEADETLPSSTVAVVSYVHDPLDRTARRMIDGPNNSSSWTFDAISRVTAESNPLGSWTYSYVDTSKGVPYLSSIQYPNGQVTNFGYGSSQNLTDWRVLQIANLKTSSGPTLSQFDYTFDSDGQITLWRQQQNGGNDYHTFGYDLAGQLTTAQIGNGSAGPPWTSQQYFEYDPAGNRTSVQSTTTTGVPTTATNYGYNMVNELTSSAPGGAVRFQGTTGSAVKSVQLQAPVITVRPDPAHYDYSVTGTSVVLSPGPWKDGSQTVNIASSSPHTGDIIGVTVDFLTPVCRTTQVNYTLVSGDTNASAIATHLAAAINNSSTGLNGHNISASASGANVTIQVNPLTFSSSVTSGAPETLTLAVGVNGSETVNVGGTTRASADQFTVSFSNSLVSGSATYTYQSGDTLDSIAAGLSKALNASGAGYGLTSVVSSVPATVNPAKNWVGDLKLTAGSNAASVVATSGGNAQSTQANQVDVASGSAVSFTHDANGCLTSDGTNTYSWDQEQRLIQITYPGTGNNTQFFYDGRGRCVKIVEVTVGSTTSTKQFVWCGGQRCEVRDSSGTVLAQLFDYGEVMGGASYYFDKDKLGSVREMTNSSGTIVWQQSFSPFGLPSTTVTTTAPDLGYAGYYYHARSGLDLTRTRAYNASLGRFINRDRIEERGGINLYEYVENDPISNTDPSGLFVEQAAPTVSIGASVGVTAGPAVVAAAGGSSAPILGSAAGAGGVAIGATAVGVGAVVALGALIITGAPYQAGKDTAKWFQEQRRHSSPECEQEWADAEAICAKELAKPKYQQRRCVTGGYDNIADCARGLVSDECGGNPTAY